MAYGENMKKLSPCGDELICDILRRYYPDASSLLDVGCGRGGRLGVLERAFPGCRFFGVDRDSDMAEQAKANTSADIRIASAEALPFPDGDFDAVLCECSLSLFASPEDSLREMHRVLHRGGVLILGELYARRTGSLPADGGEVVGRIRPREELEKMAEEAGFVPTYFEDRSGDLAAMAAQMIFDGSFCDCLGADTVALLRKVKAG